MLHANVLDYFSFLFLCKRLKVEIAVSSCAVRLFAGAVRRMRRSSWNRQNCETKNCRNSRTIHETSRWNQRNASRKTQNRGKSRKTLQLSSSGKQTVLSIHCKHVSAFRVLFHCQLLSRHRSHVIAATIWAAQLATTAGPVTQRQCVVSQFWDNTP